jgi:hypothetical protein
MTTDSVQKRGSTLRSAGRNEAAGYGSAQLSAEGQR